MKESERCGDCKYSVPCEFGNWGCYIKCVNPKRKRYGSGKAGYMGDYKWRSNKGCKSFEVRADETDGN